MRRNPDNGGSLSFRAWADGSVVYEARVYAGDTVLSGGQSKGIWVEDVFLHVLAHVGGDKGEDRSWPSADSSIQPHLLIGGVEVWGRCPVEKLEEKIEDRQEELDFLGAGGGDEGKDEVNNVPGDVAPISSVVENLRFVFVAR